MVSEFNPWEEASGAAAEAAGRAAGSLPPRPAADETAPPDDSGMAPADETVPPEADAETEGDYDPAEGRKDWVKSQGNRPRDNGKYDDFQPQSQDDARWAYAFAGEHNGNAPKYEDYYDRLWSIGFARQQDRSPTLNDWRTHYYVKYDDNEPDRAVNRVRYETRDFEWEPAQPLAVYTDKHGPWDVDRPKAKVKEKAATTGGGGGGTGVVRAATAQPLFRGSFGPATRSTPPLDEMMGPTLPIPSASGSRSLVARGANPLSDWQRGDPGSTGLAYPGDSPLNFDWRGPGARYRVNPNYVPGPPSPAWQQANMPGPRDLTFVQPNLEQDAYPFTAYMQPEQAPPSVTGATAMRGGRYFTPLVNLNQGVDTWRDELMRNLFGR